MKVISFKVNDEIYKTLRSKNVSFRSIFEPIAIDIAQNNRVGIKYTPGIPKKFTDLYIDYPYLRKVLKEIREGGKK